MRAQYDFATGVRGKYAKASAHGVNIVVLDPDVARAFPISSSVNEALRALVNIARNAQRKPRARRKST